jgi:cytosine/adenosine deaminase-related metal-dependent hydrolase
MSYPPASTRRYVLAPGVLLLPEGAARDAALAIDSGAIVSAGPARTVCERYPDWPVHKLPGRAVVPGFVDAHIHLGQAFGKAVVAGEPSQIWQRIWIPIEKMIDAEASYVSAKWMFLEALRGGYTTICNFALVNAEKAAAIHRAARETGVRLVSSTGSVDRADYVDHTGVRPQFKAAGDARARAEAHLALCSGEPLITASLCVSSVQAASHELIRQTADLCERHGLVFQIHANEHHPEVHACVTLHGRRPIEYIADAGGLRPCTLIHHAAVVSEKEVDLIRRSGAAVTYNPVASQWKTDAVAPALEYAQTGVRMGLGTDSTRSDAFRMLDAAESCQRVTVGMRVLDFSCGAGWTWVDAATRGGADACGLGKVTGKLAAGYRADLLVLDLEAPEVMPSWDFEWELVRLYNRDQIEAVVIDGRQVMSRGQPVGWDARAFLREELPRAIQAVQGSGLVRRHGPSSEHRVRRP